VQTKISQHLPANGLHSLLFSQNLFRNIPLKTMNGFVLTEIWTSPFMVLSWLRFKGDHIAVSDWLIFTGIGILTTDNVQK
jgi:hypothetical protein